MLAAMLSLHRPPVYFTQFDVDVLPPPQAVGNNKLQADPFGLAPVAGLLVEEFNHGHHPVNMSTTLTTLYGEGEYSGYRVRMRNEGNQWQPVYQHPVIDVQVVDSSPAAVTQQAHAIVADLTRLLSQRQNALRPASPLQLSLQAASTDPVVTEVGGNLPRAAGGLALLGGSLTLVALLWSDRVADAVRRRRLTHRVVPRSSTA